MTVTREVHPRLKGGSSLMATVTKLVGTDLFKSSVTKASGRSARSDGYVRNIFQYLALFRFFSFSMGAAADSPRSCSARTGHGSLPRSTIRRCAFGMPLRTVTA